MQQLLNKINLTAIDADLFDKTAEQIAKALNEPIKRSFDKHEKREVDKPAKSANKSTQIRRFYDDVLGWEEQLVSKNYQNYNELLPLIKMLNSKVAYAHARDNVDDQFRDFINHCIRQLKTDQPQTFKHFKLLFEAVLGFMKVRK